MSKLTAFLGGLGTGALSQWERNRSNDRQERLDAQNQQLFQAKMDDINLAKSDRKALADAGKGAEVNENAASLDTGDGPKDYAMPAGIDSANVAASDARQFSRNQEASGAAEAPAPIVKTGQFSVNGKIYDNRDTGLKAAKDYNAPDAVNARVAQAYRNTGRVSEAMQLEASGKQAKLTDMQLSDQLWMRDLGGALQGGHEG